MDTEAPVVATEEKVAAAPVREGGSRFQVGQLIPIGGVWFILAEIRKEGLFLVPKELTKKERVRQGMSV